MSYLARLANLSRRIKALEEKIAVRRKEINILKNAVLHGTEGGARLTIVQVNKMGASFRLITMKYALDGTPVYVRRDISETRLGRRGKAVIYDGPIRPGRHSLRVLLKWRGHGYGVYAYLKGYRFQVLSGYTFKVPSGSTRRIHVVAYERANAPLKQRPAVKFVKATAKSGKRKRGK